MREGECRPSGCSCIGHRVPGVAHMVPCCDEPHVDGGMMAERRTTCLQRVWNDGPFPSRCSMGTKGVCGRHGPHEPHPVDGRPCDPNRVDGFCHTHGVYMDPYEDEGPHPAAGAHPATVSEPGPERLPFEPPGLRALVETITYKPGWEFGLGVFCENGEARGWAFYVMSDTENSLDPSRRIRVLHEFLVPPASYNRNTWAAWLFDRVRDVETHEAGEFFRLDGLREFAPHHGNGEDPYRVWHVSDWATANKSSGED